VVGDVSARCRISTVSVGLRYGVGFFSYKC
jgi:hypothetical protein